MGLTPPSGLGSITVSTFVLQSPHIPSSSHAWNMLSNASIPASESLSSALGDTLSIPTPVLTGKLLAALLTSCTVSLGREAASSLALFFMFWFANGSLYPSWAFQRLAQPCASFSSAT